MLYKLTDANMQTCGGFQWKLGVETPELSGVGELCTSGWYHAYTDILLALFFDPIHGQFGESARLFEFGGVVGKEDYGLKVGTRTGRLLREIVKPIITLTQRRAFGILCARAVYTETKWLAWANDWLTGKDRSVKAAYAAYADAYGAAYAAAYGAAYADAAAHAAAHAAVYAAHAAASAIIQFNLKALAQEAMSYTETDHA